MPLYTSSPFCLLLFTLTRWRRELAQMNEALRLPQDRNCNNLLCAGAREVWQVCRVVETVLNMLFACWHIACAFILMVLCDVHINTNTCDRDAQTLRYLALLPKDNLKDGRQDWSSKKFIFNDVVSILTPLLSICRESPGNEEKTVRLVVCASRAEHHNSRSCTAASLFCFSLSFLLIIPCSS